MKAEIIAIGSELTGGAKLDTNSQWLSRQLTDLGIAVHFHTTVADDLAENVAVLRCAVGRADVVLITGGLGPTLDDLTREAMAALTGVPLELHEPSLAAITEMFTRRGRTMPDRKRVQAMFPTGSEPLPNPVGTAPGIWMEVPRGGCAGDECPGDAVHDDGLPRDGVPSDKAREPCRIAAMPGVPSEMYRMFDTQVRPRLPVSGRVIRRARLNCFGIGESHTEQLLGDLTARGRDPEIGITAHEATITLRITAYGASEDECDQKLRAASASIRRLLGPHVFGVEDEELQHVIVRQLNDAGKTLATVESGTGGLLSHLLTDVRDFDRCYSGGLILPTATSQQRELDIDPALFVSDGPVSQSVAGELASRCRTRLGTDFGIAITDDRGSAAITDPSLPAAVVAIATACDVRTLPVQRIGNRAIHRSRTVKSALNLLRLHLLGET